jgi:hypothetical protein
VESNHRSPFDNIRTLNHLTVFHWCVCLLLVHAATPASGQTTGTPFVAGRVGTNLVGNTYRFYEAKPEPGGGASIGRYLSPFWAVEFETWVRAANPECCGRRQRETLFSLSALRLLAHGRLQPYMLGGVTLMNGESNELQVQVGVGAQFPLPRHMALAVDLRGNGGDSTFVVRPTAGVIYYFR